MNRDFQEGDVVMINDKCFPHPPNYLKYEMVGHGIGWGSIGVVTGIGSHCVLLDTFGDARNIYMEKEYLMHFDCWRGRHNHPLTSMFLEFDGVDEADWEEWDGPKPKP